MLSKLILRELFQKKRKVGRKKKAETLDALWEDPLACEVDALSGEMNWQLVADEAVKFEK